MTEDANETYRAVEDDPTDYELLRDEIADLFNPADDDVAEVAILLSALRAAYEVIDAMSCDCQHEEPCGRCGALGRFADVKWER